jgi:hypothetical protein
MTNAPGRGRGGERRLAATTDHNPPTSVVIVNTVSMPAHLRGWARNERRAHRHRVAAVELVDGDRLSVAAAARKLKLPLGYVSDLVCEEAAAREQQEHLQVTRERLYDAWQEACPDEDWWAYSQTSLKRLEQLTHMPNRVVRELVLASTAPRNSHGPSICDIAEHLGIHERNLARRLGVVADSSTRYRNGKRYPPRPTTTIALELAARVVRAAGLSPTDVPGL